MAAKMKVLVTRKLPDAVEARLERDYEAGLNRSDIPFGPEKIAEFSRGRDAVLTCPADRFDAALIGNLDASVRIIATFSVGHEHIDLKAAAGRGITVTNTPEVLTEATADTALLLILTAARRAFEGQTLLRSGRWTGWTPTQLMGKEVTGKRLGLIGMGRIGQAVARRARAFGMTVHYHNRNRLSPYEERDALYHPFVDDLLPFCDFLSLHCPLTPETWHFLNTERIAKLPEGAVVVNTARGPIIDDAALIAALKSGHVAAAGLDVYEGEPNLDPGYLELDNAYLLPHLGSATVETRNAMGFRALDNLDAFFAGKPPPDALV